MLYQGEDIMIAISGDDVVDFENNDFKVLIYPNSRGGANAFELKKGDFSKVEGRNTFVHTISNEDSKSMQGMYNMEVLLLQEGKFNTIFKQNNAFSVESCRIKDMK